MKNALWVAFGIVVANLVLAEIARNYYLRR